MTEIWKRENRRNSLFAFVYVLILGIITAVFFDYYFDLNDDVLMKDIMSGAYSGTPSGYNIQMLYPISAVISFFYKLMPQFSWYGLFLCGCQFLCFFLIGKRSLALCGTAFKKSRMLVLQGCLVFSLMLQEMVYVQYTVTSALLAGTAMFLFYTTPIEDTRTFWKKNIWNILFLVLAFQIRTEMLLLLLPFIGIAGICKWSREKTIITKDNIVKYMGIAGAIGIGLLLSLIVSKLAYGNVEWKTFYRFFDARTSIYDFYGIPDFEENEQFYNSIGLEKTEYQLLENYNFGLDSTINADTLEAIAEYAKQNYQQEHHIVVQVKTAIRSYLQTVISTSEAPYNICVVAAYILVIVFAVIHAEKKFLWQIPLLLLTRTGLWLFILYRERAPQRITHSLYLVELLFLFSFLFMESSRTVYKKMPSIMGIVLGICAVVYLPVSWMNVTVKQDERALINQDYLALRNYCMDNPKNYYLLDVYSTVNFSEKMFVNIDNSMKNYDIMGGWASKSPIHKDALNRFGVENIEEDLMKKETLYFISEIDHMDGWLERYYDTKGIQVNALNIATIKETKNMDLGVYKIIPVKEPWQ